MARSISAEGLLILLLPQIDRAQDDVTHRDRVIESDDPLRRRQRLLQRLGIWILLRVPTAARN